MSVAAIIVAAGKGVRMKSAEPKAFLRLGGLTILERTLQAFLLHPDVERVVAAVPDPEEAGRRLGGRTRGVVLVRGGETRQDSVRLGLAALPVLGDEIILVHDAARPLLSRGLIDAVVEAARTHGAALPVLSPPDTLKGIDADGFAATTLPRDRVRLAQTPQGFRGRSLREAHERAAREGFQATDDAALIEWMGGRVALVEGSPRNMKITTPFDLKVAEAILAREAEHGEKG